MQFINVVCVYVCKLLWVFVYFGKLYDRLGDTALGCGPVEAHTYIYTHNYIETKMKKSIQSTTTRVAPNAVILFTTGYRKLSLLRNFVASKIVKMNVAIFTQ